MRKWFQPEIDFLTRNWENYTAKEIAEIVKNIDRLRTEIDKIVEELS